MMQNRRRNRVNSTLVAQEGSRLSLRVEQAFGNCPKYIQVLAPPITAGTDRQPDMMWGRWQSKNVINVQVGYRPIVVCKRRVRLPQYVVIDMP